MDWAKDPPPIHPQAHKERQVSDEPKRLSSHRVYAFAVNNVMIAARSERRAIAFYRAEFPEEGEPSDVAEVPGSERWDNSPNGDGSEMVSTRTLIKHCGKRLPAVIGLWEDRI